MSNLAAARGMSYVHGIPEIELGRELLQVLSISVHVVARVSLSRPPVAAAIMGDHPESLIEEEHQLVVPIVRAQRPAVVEHDGLRGLRAPILVENLGAVAGRDERHG